MMHANLGNASILLPDALEPLTELKCWVVWKLEENTKGKLTKIPYQAAHPDRKAKSNDPQTWATFDAACATAARAKVNGIGFVLLTCDIVAFDIDKCRDKETGVIHSWAMALVEKAGSYTEITPSGTGLRIIGRGVGARVQRKQQVIDGVSLETFRKTERFITVTGNALPDTKAELADLDALMDATVAELDAAANNDSEVLFDDGTEHEDIKPDDERLSELGQKWIALGHEGEGIAENYDGDRSRAVMAFSCECFRAGIDAKVMAARA